MAQHIVLKGKTYPIEYDSLSVGEVRFVKEETGLGVGAFVMACISGDDIDALVVLARIALKRKGQDRASKWFDDVLVVDILPKQDDEEAPGDPPTPAAQAAARKRKPKDAAE